jgi:hypothetical protein
MASQNTFSFRCSDELVRRIAYMVLAHNDRWPLNKWTATDFVREAVSHAVLQAELDHAEYHELCQRVRIDMQTQSKN